MRSRSSVTVLGLLFACVVAGTAHAGERPAGRLFYIGLALYSEAWSENDVVDLAGKLRNATAYQLVPMIASNRTAPPKLYPAADDATVASLVRRAAQQAGADDLVFIDISTHGARKALVRGIGSGSDIALPAREIVRMFAPLAGHKTVLIISACYSGSLIEDLRTPERIIITAARADRSSFGCEPGSRHTLFGEAALRAFGRQGRSLHQIFVAISEDVARMERRKHYTPSEPQVDIGAAVADLYQAPLF